MFFHVIRFTRTLQAERSSFVFFIFTTLALKRCCERYELRKHFKKGRNRNFSKENARKKKLKNG